MIITRSWLTNLTRNIPSPVVFMEAVRLGLNTKDYVRITICGVNCGIWKF